MTDGTVERMARAWYEGSRHAQPEWDALPSQMRAQIMDRIPPILRELCEPSPEMVEAGAKALWNKETGGIVWEHARPLLKDHFKKQFNKSWQAAIDAAAGEGETPVPPFWPNADVKVTDT